MGPPSPTRDNSEIENDDFWEEKGAVPIVACVFVTRKGIILESVDGEKLLEETVSGWGVLVVLKPTFVVLQAGVAISLDCGWGNTCEATPSFLSCPSVHVLFGSSSSWFPFCGW